MTQQWHHDRTASIVIIMCCETCQCCLCLRTAHSAAFPVKPILYALIKWHDLLINRQITLTGQQSRISCAAFWLPWSLVLIPRDNGTCTSPSTTSIVNLWVNFGYMDHLPSQLGWVPSETLTKIHLWPLLLINSLSIDAWFTKSSCWLRSHTIQQLCYQLNRQESTLHTSLGHQIHTPREWFSDPLARLFH